MIRKTLIFSRRCIFFALHLLTAILILGIGLLGALMWQFSKGPIDVTFAADYIKDAFRAEDHPVDVKFDRIIASWPELQGSPDLDLSNFTIMEGGEEKLHIGEVGLQLAILPLLIGQVSPEVISLNQPVIRMIREADGSFHLLLSDDSSRKKDTPLPTIKEIGNGLFIGGTLPGNLSIFSNLKAFNLRNAKLIAEDYMSGVTWVIPNISAYLNRTEDSIEVSANYMVPGRSGVSALNARIQREKEGKPLQYSADLRNVDLTLLARNFAELEVLKGQSMILNGVIEGRLDPEWKVQTATAAVNSPEGRIRLSGDGENAFSYKNLMANLVYDRSAHKFQINNTSMELNGTTVSISAEREIRADGKKYLPITLKVPELTLDQVASLWPEDYRASNAAEWLTRDLSGATLRNINVTVNVPETDIDSFSGRDVSASFDFESLKADYRNPLIPATDAKGSGTIKDDVLDIRVTSGKVGDLNVSEASVVITELASDVPGEAVIDVALSGPLTTVFDYISRDPINLGETIGIDPKKVGGDGDYKVNVTFPTSPDVAVDDVKVKVDATMRNTKLPGIVRGLDLTGGPLDLKVDGGAFTISGKGQLDGVPIDLVYSEYLDPATAPYASDIKAKLTTTEKLRHSFGFNIDYFVSGELPIEIHYKEPKPGDVTVDVTADMTPAKAMLKQFHYTKEPGAPGSATCVAVLKDGQIQQIKELNVTMGKDKVTGGQLAFGTVGKDWDVKSGSFTSLSLGSDNQFSLKFTQSAAKHLNFTVKGSKIDGRAFLKPDKTPATEPSTSTVSATVDAATMRTGDAPDQVVRNAKIAADVNAAGDITALDIAASVGKGAFRLIMKPGPKGPMFLKMVADDAGATLRAFDIYDNMVGGRLVVEGNQIKGGKINDIKGSASVRNFTIVNAPVLAKLMNALSLGGIDQLVRGQGISFTRLRTDFAWKESREGRVINLSDGRTSGASIGLSFGGTVYQAKGTVDISGTFVPLSGINKFVSSIPLVGQLLTGGKNGGIIAATYAIKGPSADPRVFVNPLSVLAPGFLRSILFEGGMDFDDEDEDPSEPVKKPQRSGYN